MSNIKLDEAKLDNLVDAGENLTKAFGSPKEKAAQMAKDVLARGSAKWNAMGNLGKAGVVGAGVGATALAARALMKRRKKAQEGFEVSEQGRGATGTAAYKHYKSKKTHNESDELIGGNNMFKNTLEDVITERYLSQKITPEKYVRLMEKIEVMSEGRALDILQEISLKGVKDKVVGTAVSVKDKMVALAKSVAATTGAAYGRCLAFIQKYYAKFGALPTKAKVIAAVGTGAVVAGGVAAKKVYGKKK